MDFLSLKPFLVLSHMDRIRWALGISLWELALWAKTTLYLGTGLKIPSLLHALTDPNLPDASSEVRWSSVSKRKSQEEGLSDRNSFSLWLSVVLPARTAAGEGGRRGLIAKARVRLLSLHIPPYTVSRTESRKNIGYLTSVVFSIRRPRITKGPTTLAF